jgi:molybdenum cofactor guanylyltransferase
VRERTSFAGATSWAVSFLAADGLVYDRDMSDASAFVLAGGRSSRMGTDKAFVEFHGCTLLRRALDLVTGITGSVHILGSLEQFGAFGDVVEDVVPDHGPLGGIHAALSDSSCDRNLILAVDMPFVTKEFLQYLLREAERSEAVVTVPRAGGNWQPLCAVYRKAFADQAESALRSGHNRIDALFRETTVRIIDEDELERAGFSAELFRNLNTREELEAAEHVVQVKR